ncbi:MAG: insulinase family protein [Ignavibacteriae bacterium]|nr:insulinase family protein [Ignavibacteriota bacterium]
MPSILGAQIGVSAGMPTSSVSMVRPSRNSMRRVRVAGRRCAASRVRAERNSTASERKSRLTTLVQWRDEPRSLASVTFNRSVYGTGHPYGVPVTGDEASIRAMKVEDLRHSTRSTFRRRMPSLSLSAMTVAQMKEKLRRRSVHGEGTRQPRRHCRPSCRSRSGPSPLWTNRARRRPRSVSARVGAARTTE